MIVEHLLVRHWRSYREPFRLDLCDGLNLVVGPNEAGKSTLLEALTRALFDRHTSRALGVRRIQPLDSSLGPEVEVIIRLGGRRYYVKKRFLVDPKSELLSERQGGFELDHEGDRADRELRRLLGGEPARGVTRAEHRGVAQALWYLQKDEPLPSGWSHAARQGLQSLAGLALASSTDEKLTTSVTRLYRETFTATGRLARRSELAQLEAEIPAHEERLQRGQSELKRAAMFRRQLAQLEERRGAVEGALNRARSHLRQCRQRVEEAADLEREQEKRLLAVQRVQAEADELARCATRLDRLEVHRRSLGQRVSAGAAREGELKADVRQLRRVAEGHAQRWEGELSPKLRRVEEELNELRARVRLDQLEQEQRLLEEMAEQRRVVSAEGQRLKVELGRAPAPDDGEWRRLRRLASAVSELEAEDRVAAVEVSFELLQGRAVRSEAVPANGSPSRFVISRPSRFEIEGVGAVSVAPLDERWRDRKERLEALRKKLNAAFEAYSVDNLEALERRVEGCRKLAERRRQIERQLEELRSQDERLGLPDLDSRIEKNLQELEALRRRSAQALLPGLEGWANDRTLERLTDCDGERQRLRDQIQREREAEQRSQSECLAKSEELERLSSEVAALRGELRSLEEQIKEQLSRFGSRQDLDNTHRRSRQQLELATSELADFRSRHLADIEGPKKALEQAEAEIELRAAELQEVQRQMADRQGRLEEVAAVGLYTEVGDLEARVDRLSRRREVLKNRSAAVKLLYELVTAIREEQTKAIGAPVAELTENWIKRLTGRAYERLDLDDDLLPRSLATERYDRPLPLESLSFGTQEQIAVLLRLAVGVVLSRRERELVVLDDRLVNADESRMTRLCELLEEAASDCQIIVTTCHPHRFESLHAARRVVLPVASGAGARTSAAEEPAELPTPLGS